MKIALAHDSFTQMGGAERVIEALHEMYSDAPAATLVVDKKFGQYLRGWKIQTSILQPLYRLWPHFKHFLVLLTLGTRSLKFNDVDVVISCSSLFLKGIKVPQNTIHINYCHTPVRFVWSEPGYIKQEVPWLLRPPVRLFLKYLRRWDYKAAQKVDHFIANSKEVQKRIQQFYHRDSTIIYPYINIDFWHPTGGAKNDYFLVAGRLQAHKDNELIIRVFNNLNLPLHIVGTGSQEKYLRSIANPNITFLGRVNDAVLQEEYSGARGFIYPQFEDFGIMPLEAAACGTPTIALAKGGSLETVVPGLTGELLPLMTESTLTEAVKAWHPEKYSVQNMTQHAAQFSKQIFQEKIKQFVAQTALQHENRH